VYVGWGELLVFISYEGVGDRKINCFFQEPKSNERSKTEEGYKSHYQAQMLPKSHFLPSFIPIFSYYFYLFIFIAIWKFIVPVSQILFFCSKN